MNRGLVTNRKSSCYNLVQKRCLIGLQKGVNKTSKGHLLEANWASLRALKSIYSFLSVSFLLQNRKISPLNLAYLYV